jgi:hypothetical protein
MLDNSSTEISGGVITNRWETESSTFEKSLYPKVKWEVNAKWKSELQFLINWKIITANSLY